MSDRYREIEGVLVPARMVAGGYGVVAPDNFYKRQQAWWGMFGSNADEDRLVGQWDLQRLRQETWNAYRNRPLAGAIADAICRGVVGTEGIIAQATTDDEDWNRRADDYEAQWWKIADYSGLATSRADNDWQECLHVINDGEVFVGLMENGQILHIEAERIVTPSAKAADKTIINGVQSDARGVVAGYWVSPRNADGVVDSTRTEFWSASDLFPVRLMGRLGTRRTAPLFSRVLAALIDLDEYREDIRLKTKHWAKQTAFHESEQEFNPNKLGGGGANFGGYQRRGTTSTGAASTTTGVAFEKVGSLNVIHGAPGDKFHPLENNLPGDYHVPFIEAAEKEICSALGVSVEWVKLAFDSSFIASRGAMIAQSPSIRRYQQAIVTQSRTRVRNWVLARAIKAGRLPPAPRDRNTGFSQWHRCFWHCEEMPILDRTKDSNADQRDYANGTATLTQLSRAYDGRDYITQKLPERVKEIRAMYREAGAKDWATRELPIEMIYPTMQGQFAPVTGDDATNKAAAAAKRK